MLTIIFTFVTQTHKTVKSNCSYSPNKQSCWYLLLDANYNEHLLRIIMVLAIV